MKLPFATCFGANLKIDIRADKPQNSVFCVEICQVVNVNALARLGFRVLNLNLIVFGVLSGVKYRRFYCRLCSACGLGHAWFVLCLGFLGVVVAITDIMDIIHSNERPPLLNESIWRSRIHRSSQRLVTPEAERDMKLMVTILSVEHYLLMIFGVLQTNPALLMPWLMMEALIIALEAIFFGMRLFVEGLSVNRAEVFMTAIVVHNWFQVFCFFRKYISLGDL